MPIHYQSIQICQSITNLSIEPQLVPICRSINKLPIQCQSWTNLPILRQSRTNSPIPCLSSACPGPILCHSTTNHTVQCQLNPSPIHQSFTNPRPTHQVDQSSITNNPPNCKNRRHSSHPQRHSIGNGRANTRPIRVTNAHLSALIIETEQPPIDGASARIEKQHANRRSIRLPTRR